MRIPDELRSAIEGGPLVHLATIDPDGRPQVSVIWIGLEGDEVVSAHLSPTQRKVRNAGADPRVVMSFLTGGTNPGGLDDYAVLHGTARITEGGAPELLGRLAQVYIGPGTVFPPMPNPPAGVVMRTTVERIGGVGPWAG